MLLNVLSRRETRGRDFHVTGVERFFDEDEIIVSKTDNKGLITYANDVFLKVAGFTEADVIGKPHNLVRHPDMPKCVFKLLWDQVRSGNEIFAYVVNRAKNGDHYWVFAHVTPSYNKSGELIGFHSNRRVPKRSAVEALIPVYKNLCLVESQQQTPKQAMEASMQLVINILEEKKMSYDEFVLSL